MKGPTTVLQLKQRQYRTRKHNLISVSMNFFLYLHIHNSIKGDVREKTLI